ncbi:MAG: AAA family ATPase [Deltaproteobacteria bacterium]|nr:AAA family ATPase [Deltaproteobacteria bacterium]
MKIRETAVQTTSATATATATTPATTKAAKAKELSPDAKLFPMTLKAMEQTAPVGSFKPHARFEASFAAAFLNVKGPSAIADLKKLFTETLLVTFGGDQLTGKSTQSKGLAATLKGTAGGTGAIVRKMAADAGYKPEEIGEFAKELAKNPTQDVELDYRALQLMAKGDVTTFESRLAGHLAEFLRQLGRKNVVSVYLKCAPKELALRYVQREVSPAARARIEPLLNVPKSATFIEALEALGKIDDADAKAVAAKAQDIAGRDVTDLKRLKLLYGVNYQDTSSFDLVVDTTGKTPEQIQDEIKAFVDARANVA